MYCSRSCWGPKGWPKLFSKFSRIIDSPIVHDNVPNLEDESVRVVHDCAAKFGQTAPVWWLNGDLTSRVWLQTKLDDIKSHYQLIIKITIFEKRRTARLWKKRKKICPKKINKGGVNCLIGWSFKTATLNVIDSLNCPITNALDKKDCSITIWQVN